MLEHSEHALVLLEPPADGPTDPSITLRTAKPADSSEISGLLMTGFGMAPSGLIEAAEVASTLLVERAGSTVGTLRVSREADQAAGIYGFAIDPLWQGRGIGRDVLRRVCQQLQQEGILRIGLEVAVDNDHAMGLYTSLGFAPVTTEDYYALPPP